MDFFMGFINTVNDCIDKPEGEAYCDLIKANLLGELDSLVICPDCGNEVKNFECFTQLTLPIKTKTKKVLYNYVLFDNPLVCRNGKAEVRDTWTEIKSDLGVAEDCLIFGGAEGDSGFAFIDLDIAADSALKKFKK